jgi:hypothetical protein
VSHTEPAWRAPEDYPTGTLHCGPNRARSSTEPVPFVAFMQSFGASGCNRVASENAANLVLHRDIPAMCVDRDIAKNPAIRVAQVTARSRCYGHEKRLPSYLSAGRNFNELKRSIVQGTKADNDPKGHHGALQRRRVQAGWSGGATGEK